MTLNKSPVILRVSLVLVLFLGVANVNGLQLNFRSLHGTFTVDVKPEDTIAKVKDRIEDLKKVDVSQQKLKLDGKELDDLKTVAEQNLTEASDLVFIEYIKARKTPSLDRNYRKNRQDAKDAKAAKDAKEDNADNHDE